MAVPLRRGVRFAPLAAPVVLAVVLAACGSNGGDGRVDVTIGPTSFVTRPPVTQAPAAASLLDGETLPDDATNTASQQYEIQANDNLSKIASLFKVDIDDIVSINEWSDGLQHNLYPGDTIVIPPGGLDVSVVERSRSNSNSASNSNDGSSDVEDSIGGLSTNATAKCDDGSDRPTYEVQTGDYQGKVANDLDIALDDLATVNANNPNWNSFIVGEDIWLPCDGELDSGD